MHASVKRDILDPSFLEKSLRRRVLAEDGLLSDLPPLLRIGDCVRDNIRDSIERFSFSDRVGRPKDCIDRYNPLGRETTADP